MTGDLTLGSPRSARQLGAGRLHVASLVPRAALQHHGLAVPAPGHAEPGERLAQHRRVERRFAPALAAVGRDHHLRDPAVARIGETGNLVKPGPFNVSPGDGWVTKDLTSCGK